MGILHRINFEFNAVHPHQFVLHQCNELKTSTNIAKLAWSICNDCMHSKEIVLSFEPHHISAAAIYIASEFLLNTAHLDKQCDDDDMDNMMMSHSNSSNSSNMSSPIYRSFSSNSNTHALSPQSFDGTKEPNWWRRFDIEDEKIENIGMLIMDLYESPFVKFEDEKKEKMHLSEDDDVDLKKKIKMKSPNGGDKV